MDQIKEAFQKVKQDVDLLKKDLDFLKENIVETRQKIIDLCNIVLKLSKKEAPTHKQDIPTVSTHPSTHSTRFKPLKTQNMLISTGNQGVSTDRQTDRQTHQQTQKTPQNTPNSIENAVEMLESLDNLKREIRLKFKRLTDQEWVVFSTIYQFDEEQISADHKALSKKLGLSESSIRDYVGRLIKKGIPVEKKRINNKQISLSISPNLKKIASLPTILQLREL
ncbi:MAG: BlaI/MecI/CopY family transcriptional regulator [Nanoarchaeota archaeon]|nr:BlaI/MecI/CopY family transcriptional regulator [Nanoarchaeota archaeon]MBU1028006.1 BlaI/MecI/CopY family transcriptional regulator [Nanoarchaeota archaeon]